VQPMSFKETMSPTLTIWCSHNQPPRWFEDAVGFLEEHERVMDVLDEVTHGHGDLVFVEIHMVISRVVLLKVPASILFFHPVLVFVE